jgi:hypothetical protein
MAKAKRKNERKRGRGTKTGRVRYLANRDYPLTWEQHASQARYEGMKIVAEEFVRQRLAAPHTWHAAEVFLYLTGRPDPAN